MNFDRRGLIGTLVIHLLALIIFLVLGFKTPLPLPAEQGLLINFGDSETGFGAEEPEKIEEQPKDEPQPVSKPVEEVSSDDAYMTQDLEEAPEAKASAKTREKKEEPERKEISETEKAVEKKPEVKKPEKPKVNQKAMYSGRKPNSSYTGSEGEETGSGNQGSLTGSENATDRSLGISSGDGISFSLAGRNPVNLISPKISTQLEGKVVVRIKVDRSGRITSAEPGVKGSTTLETELLNAAKKAALSSKFDTKSDAPFFQTGTITYIYKLK